MPLDRKKNAIDVLERVLGHDQTDDRFSSHTEVVQLDVRGGVGAATTSVVQLTVLDSAAEPASATIATSRRARAGGDS